jgi:hypothetical protein
MIKQTLLRDILDRRAILADLRSAFEAAKEDLERIEHEVIAAVEAGERHERGPISAGVSTEVVRRPKWKEEFVRACGAEAAERVIAATVPSEHPRLVIVERRPRAAK